MNTGEDIRALRKVLDMSRAAGILGLFLHFYYYCYPTFLQWQLTAAIPDRILQHIADTGLFDHPGTSKALALLFLALSMMGARGPKDEAITVRSCLWMILPGTVFYFGSIFLLSACHTIAYLFLTTAGFILVLTGGGRLSRILHPPFRKDDPFGKERLGFPQEERQRLTDFSINLPAQYSYKGETRNSWVNLINPRRGILILGSPGSGKSWFIIEPIIRQLIEKGFALFIYDFKYDALTRLAYTYFQTYQDRYPPGTAFYSINFSDLSRSHRCNLIHPSTLDWMSDALGISRVILFSMNKSWIHQQGDFFVESPVNFLAAIIWYLRKYRDGIYCTLPHAIELSQLPYDQLFTILNSEPEIRTLVGNFIETFRNKSFKLLDSQISSAKIPLGRLASPDLYYILTGNDCTLDINDPLAPKILCLGGDPARQETLSPVLSLYIDRMNKRVNQKDKYKCGIICDEFGTVRATSMMTTVATARSNNIVPVLALQDLSQLRTQYSRDEADQLFNMTGNLLCGQVGGDTARLVSERFPRIWQDKTSFSTNSSDTSISQSQQWEQAISPATIATLSAGEFLGVVADDPGREMELKAFHGRLVKEEAPVGAGGATRSGDMPALLPLPVVQNVDAAAVLANFQQVRQDIVNLVSVEMGRIVNDPAMIGSLVIRE